MKLFKCVMPILAAIQLISTACYGQERGDRGQQTGFNRELRNRDDQAVQTFIDSKQNIPVKEKSNNLQISGDVRFEYTRLNEKGLVIYDDEKTVVPTVAEAKKAKLSDRKIPTAFHEQLRGQRGGDYVDLEGLPISQNDFDVEFNIKLKYTFDKSWAQAHVQYDNSCGIKNRKCADAYAVFNESGSETVKQKIPINARSTNKGSGESGNINLKRAFIGYNVWADGKDRVDVEVGRRKLSDAFDSEIQFTARFDGILLKYASAIDEVADFYWDTAGFVIDERVNHFGWVTEFGFLNTFDTGLDVKYSFIDWRKFGRNRCRLRYPDGMAFANSQVTLEYNFTPEIQCYKFPAQIYAGFLVNHAAMKSRFSRKRENLGAYAGIYVGEVHKKGDWSVDIEYIYVQAQAVPDFDVGSIGRGNIQDDNFYEIYEGKVDPLPGHSGGNEYNSKGKFLGYYGRRGNANFKGWRFDTLYAITDNLSVEMIYEFSNEVCKSLGGKHQYSDFEIELIYAF